MEQKYVVSVDKCESAQEDEIVNEKGHEDNSYSQEVCYEVAKTEYEHTLRRIAKLDQKISLTLAVCALIAPMLCDSIKIVKEYSPWVVIYYFGLMIIFIMFIVLIGVLIYLLKTENISHYDPTNIIKKNMIDADSSEVVKAVCINYRQYILDNSNLLNKKSKLFNICIYVTMAIVIAIFVVKMISKFL